MNLEKQVPTNILLKIGPKIAIDLMVYKIYFLHIFAKEFSIQYQNII